MGEKCIRDCTFFKPVPDHAPTLVLQHQVVHLCPVLGDHLGPWLNHLGIHSRSEDPCMGRAHQVPTNKTTGQLYMEVPWGRNTSDKILLQLICRRLNTYRDKELLDLLHGMSHTQIGLWYGCHHLDEHMQLHGQVSIFGLTTLSQLFLLMKILNANDNIQNMSHRNNGAAAFKQCSKENSIQTLFLSLMEPLPRTEILAPVSSCSLLIVLP